MALRTFSILGAFLAVLSLPFVVRWAGGPSVASGRSDASRSLVIATPHVEQICHEFGLAFDAWHRRRFGEGVRIDWRQPGGTSEIIRMLEAQFEAAARAGRLEADGRFEQGVTGFDLLFGGGSFEHGKMSEIRSITARDGDRTVTRAWRMGLPAGFTQEQMREWFASGDPANASEDWTRVGVQPLFDPPVPSQNHPGQIWIGTALSGFGIVYNRDVLKDRGLPEPTQFEHLADPRYRGGLALTDPRLSGSVATTYESILNKEGWENGWRLLRAMSANARYFASSATRPPIDVSQGEAAAGLAIDFYGRGQSQFILRPGERPEDSRVGYVDPPGATYIDPDPVTILNGCSDFDLSRRFVEFCLSDEAQALWQMPARSHARGASNPPNPEDPSVRLGPHQYELRRMPVRRSVYERFGEYFIDRADPFVLATPFRGRGWRHLIGPMLAASGIDTASELRAAWGALHDAKSRLGTQAAALDEAERLIYAMPVHTTRAGAFTPEEVGRMSSSAYDELLKRKIPTISALRGALPALQTEWNASGTRSGGDRLLQELRALADSRAEADAETPLQLPLEEGTYRAIRLDTDSWKDPGHGRLSLISYTSQIRRNYNEARRLAEAAR